MSSEIGSPDGLVKFWLCALSTCKPDVAQAKGEVLQIILDVGGGWQTTVLQLGSVKEGASTKPLLPHTHMVAGKTVSDLDKECVVPRSIPAFSKQMKSIPIEEGSVGLP